MTRIAFVSCANIELRPHQPAWADIAASRPDLLLLLGDNTYMNWETGDPWEPERLEENYRRQFQLPAFRHLLDTVPTLATWDDHDLGPDDSCGAELAPDQLLASRALFDQYLVQSLNIAPTLNNNRPHMYGSHDIGPVRVIMLDVRSHRTWSTHPEPTVLGAAQEAWLWQQLADNTQPYTVVCSGSVINRGAKGHKFKDYPAFHQRLMAELEHHAGAERPRRVLFLSGDIHDNRWKQWPGFYEATSSGVACISPANQGSQPIDNWGLVEFDQVHNSLTVTLNGHAPSTVGVQRVLLDSWLPTA